MTQSEFHMEAKRIAELHGFVGNTIFCTSQSSQYDHRPNDPIGIDYKVSIRIGGVFSQTNSLPSPQAALAHLEAMLKGLALANGENHDIELSAPVGDIEGLPVYQVVGGDVSAITLTKDADVPFVVTKEIVSKEVQCIFEEITQSNNPTFEVGDTVVVVANDPMDARVGIKEENRWKIGETFVIDKIEMFPWGDFLYDSDGHNLYIRRAKLVSRPNELQQQSTEESEVVE